MRQRLFILMNLALLICPFSPVSAQDAALETMEETMRFLLAEFSVVTATKHPQKVREAPAVISVITSQQIRQRGYVSVGEALQCVPGLDVLTDHLQYNLGIRGINGGMQAWSRIVKVMIDNQPVSFRASGENWLGPELVPIGAVERIEIVRGPTSALYGANAFLGVINIITKAGEAINGKWARLRLGRVESHLTYGGEVVFGREIDGLNVLISGSGSRTDRSGLTPINMPDAKQYENTMKSSHDLTKPVSFFAKTTYEHNRLGHFALDFNYQQFDSYGEFQDWAALTHENRIVLHNFYARGRYSRAIGSALNCNFSGAVAQGSPMEAERLAVNQQGFADWLTRDMGYNSFDLTSDISWSFHQNNALTFGVDHTADRQDLQTYYRHLADLPPVPTHLNDLTNKTFVNTGMYAQSMIYPANLLDFRYLRRLGITLGIRYDWHNIYEDVFNYRLAGVYQLTPQAYAKFLYGTSFKAPSAVQLFTNYISPTGVLGNPQLKPEKAHTFEVALGWQVLTDLNVTVNGFYSTVEDKVELIKSLESVNVIPENISRMDSKGFEVETLYQRGPMEGYVNISYQKSTLKKPDLMDPLQHEWSVDTRLYPAYRVNFGLNYEIPDYYLNLNLNGHIIGSRIASEQNISAYDLINNVDGYKLDAYGLLDVVIASKPFCIWGKGELEVRLKIANALNQEYAYPGFKDFDIPGLGRAFTFEINQKF